MSRLIRFAVSHPKAVVATWLAVVVVLGMFGTTVEKRLSPSDITVAGTESGRATRLHQGHYGFPLVVLLNGPARDLREQGTRLVARLRAMPDARVLSPWDGPIEAARLRVRHGGALVTIDATPRKGKTAFDTVMPVRRTVDATIRAPVTAHVTGQPAIGLGLNKAVIKATQSAERLALPILILVLLLVFRSPVAAGIPVAVAIGTVFSGFGLIAVAASLRSVDAIALSIASMIGLALGVDYSLLIVSRFRELLDEEPEVPRAAVHAGLTAGRTTVFAGSVLLLVMAVPLLLSPGTILFSAALGAMLVALLSIVGSILVTPSLLTLLGHKVNRWQIGTPRKGDGGTAAAVGRRVTRRPAIATALLLVLLLALASPSLASKTAPPDVRQLPPDNPERQDYDAVRNSIGPGWTAVLDIAINSPNRPLTDPRMLAALDRYQTRIARLPNVALVVGPGALRHTESQIRRIPIRLSDLAGQLNRGRRGARRLHSGLGRATGGIQQVRKGLGDASTAAVRIADGSRQAGDGAQRLATGASAAGGGAAKVRDGLGLASSGARRLSSGLSQAHSAAVALGSGASQGGNGAQRLADGLAKAQSGAHTLSSGALELAGGLSSGADELQRLHEPAQVAGRELNAAWADLRAMTVGKTDAKYIETTQSVGKALAAVSGRDPTTGARVSPGYDGLDASLTAAVAGARSAGAGARRLSAGASDLEAGIARLRRGAATLSGGLDRIRNGEGRLTTGLAKLGGGSQTGASGLERLYSGAGTLTDGLKRLTGGAGRLSTGVSSLQGALRRLADGLTSGHARSQPLAAGLTLMTGAVQRFRKGLQSGDIKGFEAIRQRLPGLFDSGYLPLAAVDGSRVGQRRLARMVIDFDKGGQTGRVLVTPHTAVNDPRTDLLIRRLSALTGQFQRETGIDAAVGGAPAEFSDYVRAMVDSLPLLIFAIALLTFLGLVPIVRALPLALVAVLLNLLTVAAAVGVLTLTFVGKHPPLGGPGAIDIVGLSAIFAITFALSIDYEVFLLSRMREEYARSRDPDEAVAYGLRGTAHVVTGAAMIMVGVFAAFSLSNFITISQFGVGLGTAVLLDATVVRLLLLPAIMRLLGNSAWWMPRWLDRAMPTVDIEGPTRPLAVLPQPKLASSEAG